MLSSWLIQDTVSLLLSVLLLLTSNRSCNNLPSTPVIFMVLEEGAIILCSARAQRFFGLARRQQQEGFSGGWLAVGLLFPEPGCQQRALAVGKGREEAALSLCLSETSVAWMSFLSQALAASGAAGASLPAVGERAAASCSPGERGGFAGRRQESPSSAPHPAPSPGSARQRWGPGTASGQSRRGLRPGFAAIQPLGQAKRSPPTLGGWRAAMATCPEGGGGGGGGPARLPGYWPGPTTLSGPGLVALSGLGLGLGLVETSPPAACRSPA